MSHRAEDPSPMLDTAEEVRNFYDCYPYPRPIDSLETYRQLWQDPHRRRAEFHLLWPDRPYREDHSILIAGCGTSQAAKHALRWPKAQVIGVDISATSVQCTEEVKRKYNLTNLQVCQLPIERLSDLQKTFDHIVCTGVLHHLVDPDAGLAALRKALKPDGAMHLMVYAPYGRSGIYMLQDFCKRVGIHATDDGIRDLIAALRMLPAGHPLENLLRQAPDFRHEAALADALLHPQDRAYSVPQFFDFIERGGMRFGRWIKQAPYSGRCGAMAHIPQASRMAQLPLEEQYATAELFRGTMVRHSAIVYRDDGSSTPWPVSFTDDVWLSYVPIRMSETICVQERLPAGAAGVLINRNHTYTDLFTIVSPTEKHIFEAIDGSRTIGDLLKTTLPSWQKPPQLSAARAFFERLWWHDQVVFDATGQAQQTGPLFHHS